MDDREGVGGAIGLVGYVLTVVTSAFGAPAFAMGGWRREIAEAEETEVTAPATGEQG